MTWTMAVAGKGGVGKTTFSALAIRHLHESTGKVVLAVDADPNANLGAKLGIAPGRTLGEIREDVVSKVEEPSPGMSKHELVEYQIRLALKEGDGVDLITMGRQEGPGCYCYVNNLLRMVVDALVDRYDYVVIDNEAGMEHLSRRTTRSANVLFIVSDGTAASLKAANTIASLAEQMKLKIKRKALVLNRVAATSVAAVAKGIDGFDRVYSVRTSNEIANDAQESESLIGLMRHDPAFSDVAEIVDAERKLL